MRFFLTFLMLITLPLVGFSGVVAPSLYTGLGAGGVTSTGVGGVGGANYFLISNPDNTAATASDAYFEVSVGGTTTIGDPSFRYTIPGGTSWYTAVDNSASDIFILGTGSTVGSSSVVKVNSSTIFVPVNISGNQTGTAAANFLAANNIGTGSSEWTGGSGADSGGNVKGYGATHSTKASILELRSGANIMAQVDTLGLGVKSAITGLGRLHNAASTFNIANDASTTIDLGSSAAGLLMLTQNSNGHSCMFFVHAGQSPGIVEMQDPNSVCSVTTDTATSTNVTNPSQAGVITIQNKGLGATKSYSVMFLRNNF